MEKTGGCNCGQIRYQVTGAPLFVHVCHCHECQRDSGGAFNMTMLLLEKDFQVTNGAAIQKLVTRASSKQYHSYFCGDCGNPLYGMPVDSLGIMVLRPGSLDDTTNLQPQAHIWTREKQNWVVIDDNIPVFEKEYDLYQEWPRASLDKLETLINNHKP